MNPKTAIIGEIEIIPLFIIELRLCLDSYRILAKANIPDDVNPWEIIMINAPTAPKKDEFKNIILNILIWTTEEYAIITFMSEQQTM